MTHDPEMDYTPYQHAIAALKQVGVAQNPDLIRLTQLRLRLRTQTLRRRRQVMQVIAGLSVLGVISFIASLSLAWRISDRLQSWWSLPPVSHVVLLAGLLVTPVLLLLALVPLLEDDPYGKR